MNMVGTQSLGNFGAAGPLSDRFAPKFGLHQEGQRALQRHADDPHQRCPPEAGRSAPAGARTSPNCRSLLSLTKIRLNPIHRQGLRVSCQPVSGWGGAFGFADPVRGLGVACAMNRMGTDLAGDPRNAALIAAVYEGQEARR